MGKGKAHPDGVRCYGFGRQDSRGKAHPDTVNAGQATVAGGEGSSPAITLASGGSAKIAGVTQHSGKENYTTVRHLNASHSGPKKASGADARPDGVRVFKDAAV